MIEIFKTDIKDEAPAMLVVEAIHNHFAHLRANFDLKDRDNILRVESLQGPLYPEELIQFINNYGHTAEVLEG